MTKDRFCRLVMSKGYSGNYAEGMVQTFLAEIRIRQADEWVTKSGVLGDCYDRLWKFFMAAHSQEIDPWLALLCPVDDAIKIIAQSNAKSLEEDLNRRTEQIMWQFKDYYDQRKDQWAKYWEEKEKGADKENETK